LLKNTTTPRVFTEKYAKKLKEYFGGVIRRNDP